MLQIMLAPPLGRCQPFWYAANFSLVTSCFAKIFSKAPARLLILPPFDCNSSSFTTDGIHLTSGEGERYNVSSSISQLLIPLLFLVAVLSYSNSIHISSDFECIVNMLWFKFLIFFPFKTKHM
jgi:hypothetical protein